MDVLVNICSLNFLIFSTSPLSPKPLLTSSKHSSIQANKYIHPGLHSDSTSGKEPACQCRSRKRCGFDPWVGKIPWRREWQPTPVFLPEKSHGQRSLVGYGPQGRKDSDTSEATQHSHVHSLGPFAYTSLVYCLSILHENTHTHIYNVLGSLKTHKSTNIIWGGIYQNISQEKENAKLGSASSLVPSQSCFHITFLISVSTESIICFWRDVNHLTVVLCHPLFFFKQ